MKKEMRKSKATTERNQAKLNLQSIDQFLDGSFFLFAAVKTGAHL